jgi:P-type Ca2+ transporter type 2C
MGGRGTEVAREAATIVLLDDNFATITVAIREGRRIFDNLRTAFAYLVAFHVPLLAAALLIPFTGEPLLLLPVHLILLQIVGHPTAALAFEGDRPAPDVMRRPPRAPGSSLLSRGALINSLAVGATLATAVLAVYLQRLESGAPTRDARASAFVTLLVGDVLLVLVVRARREPFWQVGARGNRSLWAVVVVTIAMVVAALALPRARDLLRLGPLEASDVAFAVGAAVLATAWTGVLAVARGQRSRRHRTLSPTREVRGHEDPDRMVELG